VNNLHRLLSFSTIFEYSLDGLIRGIQKFVS
jgi:hypothetical protein